MKNKILILGSSGFLGKKIIVHFKKRYKLFTSHNHKKRKNILNNKNNLEKFVVKNKITIILNLIKEKNIKECLNINKTILFVAQKYDLKIIYFSSCLIYGKQKKICSEKTNTKPYDQYTKIKDFTEKLYINSNINFKILRIGNIYDDNFEKKGLIRNLYLNMNSEIKAIYIKNQRITRNFIYYKDFLKILKILINNFDNIKPKIFNCGNENIMISKLINKMSKIYKKKPNIVKNNKLILDPSIKISNRLNNKIFNINNKVKLFEHLKTKLKNEKYF